MRLTWDDDYYEITCEYVGISWRNPFGDKVVYVMT